MWWRIQTQVPDAQWVSSVRSRINLQTRLPGDFSLFLLLAYQETSHRLLIMSPIFSGKRPCHRPVRWVGLQLQLNQRAKRIFAFEMPSTGFVQTPNKVSILHNSSSTNLLLIRKVRTPKTDEFLEKFLDRHSITQGLWFISYWLFHHSDAISLN